jgi:predicted PurR-regulated permease PerM
VDAARIQARAVVKVAAISLAVIAASLLGAIIVLHVRTEIRWVFAALFLALAMNPAVDRVESLRLRGHKVFPRWLAILAVYVLLLALFAFLILQVIPPIIREFEHLGSKVPGYVDDFRRWANQNQQFRCYAAFMAWLSGLALRCASNRPSLVRCPLLLAL